MILDTHRVETLETNLHINGALCRLHLQPVRSMRL